MPNQLEGQGNLISREDAILDSVPRRASRQREILEGRSLRSAEWKAAHLVDKREPRVKVDDVGEVLTMSYRKGNDLPEYVLIATPRKYMDMEQSIRGNSRSHDGSIEAKTRISGVLDVIEEVVEDLKIDNPDETLITSIRDRARQRLIEEGFIDEESGKIRAIKPRRKSAIEQSVLRDLDLKTLLAGRALIARAVAAAGNANWLLELVDASLANFKAEKITSFLSRVRKDAQNSLSAILNGVDAVKKDLKKGRSLIVTAAQAQRLQDLARRRLNHKFKPFLESELLIRLLLLGELDLPTVEKLFAQNKEEGIREDNFKEFRKFVRDLPRLEDLVIRSAEENDNTDLIERLEAVRGIAKGTITFSRNNLGRSRVDKDRPNSKSLPAEELPFTA